MNLNLNRRCQHFRTEELLLTFLRTAVLHAGGQVFEAVGVPLAPSIRKWLTLHGGHVEEVDGEEGTAGSLVFRKPADLGNLCQGN